MVSKKTVNIFSISSSIFIVKPSFLVLPNTIGEENSTMNKLRLYFTIYLVLCPLGIVDYNTE